MRSLVLAAVLAIVPSTAAASAQPDNCQVTARQTAGFAAKVWSFDRWRRGAPAKRTRKAHRRHLRCAAGPNHRKVIRRRWRGHKRAYNRYRAAKFAELREAKAQSAYVDAITPPGLGVLEAIAACESGGNPGAISPSGTYRGKYQFDYGTWASVGGSGDPAAASEQEQDERAAALYRARGSAPWPVCGV